MQIIDISSLIKANLPFEDVIRASYIIQETRRTTDSVFFIDTSKLDEKQVSDISDSLTKRGISPFITNKPLYHYINAAQNSDNTPIELLSQDYLAISRADSNTFIWDISSMKRYSTSEFSTKLLDFPHDRLGLFALLTQDDYHNIKTGVEFYPSHAVALVQNNESLQSLIKNENIPVNLQESVNQLRVAAKSVASQLRISREDADFENYFSSITLSKDEMRSLRGRSVEVTDEQINYFALDDQVKIAQLIKKINENEIPKIFINLGDDHIAVRVNDKSYISSPNENINIEQIYNTFSPLFEDDKIEKVCFSAKSSHRASLSKGINIYSLNDDIEMAEFTLNNLSKQSTIEDLMTQYFFEPPKMLNKLHKVADQLECTERLHEKLITLLKEDGSYKHYHKIEVPMAKVLANIEHNGVYINSGKLLQISSHVGELLAKEENAIRQFSPNKLNINTPKDVAHLLFDVLKFPAKTRSTSEDNLLKINKTVNHPVIQHILNARKYSKLNSTFALKLPKKIDSNTNRVHCTYNQNKVKTGRLSSEDPNLQNIPIRTKLGRAIRQAFEAGKSRKIIAADYSQVELKILAHLSQEDKLIDAFKSGRDIHQSTAAIIFDKKYEQVTGDERKAAKSINFGLIYGMTQYGLATELGITVPDAQKFIETYFKSLPKTEKFIKQMQNFAAENGFVKTITGRKIHIKNADSSDKRLQESALRAASNAPMQGSASDIIKLAMIKIHHELKSRQLDAVITMQVHDEIVLESSEEHEMEVAMLVKDCMENAVKLSVGLDVSVGIGKNWENAHPIEIKKEKEVEEISLEP